MMFTIYRGTYYVFGMSGTPGTSGMRDGGWWMVATIWCMVWYDVRRFCGCCCCFVCPLMLVMLVMFTYIECFVFLLGGG
jgi:hypothetical protein